MFDFSSFVLTYFTPEQHWSDMLSQTQSNINVCRGKVSYCVFKTHTNRIDYVLVYGSTFQLQQQFYLILLLLFSVLSTFQLWRGVFLFSFFLLFFFNLAPHKNPYVPRLFVCAKVLNLFFVLKQKIIIES